MRKSKRIEKPEKRAFLLLSPEIIEFHSRNAREAALKAASKEVETIVMLDNLKSKLHIFHGGKRPLAENEMNEFTRTNQMYSKPFAQKMAAYSLERQIDMKRDTDVYYLNTLLEDVGCTIPLSR